MRHRTTILIATACTTLLLLSACKDSEEKRYRRIPEGAGVIAFVGAGQNDPLWPILRAGAERFEREQGLVEVHYAAPPVVSPEQQIALIRSLINPSLRGVCVQVIDPNSLGPVLTQARQSGAQIVTIMRRVENIRVDGHVGYDQEAIGKALADATVRYLNSQGSIMILRDGGPDRAMRNRYESFMDVIKPVLGIERWAEAECEGDPLRARREIVSLSARFPRLSAWVSMAPWPLMGYSLGSAPSTAPAVASPLPAGCTLITCGSEPWMWPYIESGLCPFVVGFNYADAGLKALQFCQAAIQAPGPGGREYGFPIRFVTPANLTDYKHDWAVWSAPTSNAP